MNRDIKILITFAVIMITTIISIIFQWKVFLFVVLNDIPLLNPIVDGLSPWIIPRIYSFLFTGLFIIFPSYLLTKKYIWFEEKIRFENFKFINFRTIKLPKLPKISMPKISMPKISKKNYLNLLKYFFTVIIGFVAIWWFFPDESSICHRYLEGTYSYPTAEKKWLGGGRRYGSERGLVDNCGKYIPYVDQDKLILNREGFWDTFYNKHIQGLD